ncbi:formyltransferase family protein [Acinetobacter vivianii]
MPDDIDLILCAHTHCYIAAEARQKCKLGAIGFHPSLLPSYKGKNAIQDAINAGENETGGSILLDDGWDTGQVLFQQTCMIGSQDTAQSLWINKLAPMALNMFRELLINLQVKEALPM